jgi:hypothetical protein
MKNNRKTNRYKRVPTFVARAQRAFGRVARKVRAENRKLGLAPVVWPNGNPNAEQLARESADLSPQRSQRSRSPSKESPCPSWLKLIAFQIELNEHA